MASNTPHSCEDDIEVMIRTGVWDWRHKRSDRYKWPNEAILVVQSTRLNHVYHSIPKSIHGGKHAECAFLDDLESTDQSLSFEDHFSMMSVSRRMTEYKLYINYSPCVDCAERIIRFINDHPSVKFHINYAMTYHDGSGLRKLKHQDRITLATMSDYNWKSVITSFLDININKLQNLKQKIQNKSGYESLEMTVKDLGIESSPKWIQLRGKSDKNEQKKLKQVYEEDNYIQDCNDLYCELCDCYHEGGYSSEEGYYIGEGCPEEEYYDNEEGYDDEDGYYEEGYDDEEGFGHYGRGYDQYRVGYGHYGRGFDNLQEGNDDEDGYGPYGRGYRQYGVGYGHYRRDFDNLWERYDDEEGYGHYVRGFDYLREGYDEEESYHQYGARF